METFEEHYASMHAALQKHMPGADMALIDRAVDFSFINEMVAGSYCREFGRPAKEPELMAKLLFLEHIYDLSDEKVIKRLGEDAKAPYATALIDSASARRLHPARPLFSCLMVFSL